MLFCRDKQVLRFLFVHYNYNVQNVHLSLDFMYMSSWYLGVWYSLIINLVMRGSVSNICKPHKLWKLYFCNHVVQSAEWLHVLYRNALVMKGRLWNNAWFALKTKNHLLTNSSSCSPSKRIKNNALFIS